MTLCSSKIVVFDLDETLGYFMEFGMLWDSIKLYIKDRQITQTQLDQKLFNSLLDLYPEFLRPNIIDILKYLKKKKQKNHCDKLMIYTNNQGPLEWARFIIGYFEEKIDYKIFDQIIGAFKVHGKRVELCRTTHMKTHSDLIKCTKLPLNTQICFLDDVYYPDMSNEKIYYINVKPYVYDLKFDDMITRFINGNIIRDINDSVYCREFLSGILNKYHYIYTEKNHDSQLIDKIVSKKILEHLHSFFKMKPIRMNTKRRQHLNGKAKTLKKR